ncbi:Octanoyltransferase [Paraconexibacter sp. AEG42_29]|uniref:Octanoyltransferase n=1 Tax=Paraconexibacter sp. AEG42_29 TaxID=2997339 RepID=A0AAU7AP00_9ACTN
MAIGELRVVRLGLVEYRRALDLQLRLCAERQQDTIPDTLLLLEHPMVYTQGRRTEPHDLPMGREWYAGQGIDVVDVDRGGKVTYHGPGQLVGYTIMRAEGVQEFVRRMERALLAGIRAEGVDARTRNDEGRDYTGIWVADRKVASIGIHVSRGVTTHGFSVNVTCDLQPFGWVVPCGLPESQATSILKEIGGDASPARLAGLADRMAVALAAEHDLEPVDADAATVLPAPAL